LSGKDELADVSGNGAIRLREKCQIGPNARRDRDDGGLRTRRIRADIAVAGVGRESEGDVRQAFDFPQFLVIGEEERAVPLDGSSDGTPELIAAEGRLLGIEEVASVHRAVSQKLKDA